MLMAKERDWEFAKKVVRDAGELLKQEMEQIQEIREKSDRRDIVTSVDESVQAFLVEKIQKEFPTDLILAEESEKSTLSSMEGRVWIIDPIDGTLNFVYQKKRFSIMLALFVNGVGQIGVIYDVMSGLLYSGGCGLGVFCNEQHLSPPSNVDISEGLVGINQRMYVNNAHHIKDFADKSMGVRLYGSASLNFCYLLEGELVAYMSRLQPWDWAPGSVLAKELGLETVSMDGKELSFETLSFILTGTPKVIEEFQKL